MSGCPYSQRPEECVSEEFYERLEALADKWEKDAEEIRHQDATDDEAVGVIILAIVSTLRVCAYDLRKTLEDN